MDIGFGLMLFFVRGEREEKRDREKQRQMR